MNTQSTPAVPEVPGIDLEFCPRSYFLPPGINVKHLAHVAGHERRKMARALLAAGEEDLPPELLTELLDEEARTAIGKLHPMFMGGEYLPPLEPDEIEIARISLASVTADQISVRARKCSDGIEYRIVDEYEEASPQYVCRPQTSQYPLTLRGLVALIDGSCDGNGAVFAWLTPSHADDEDHFVTVSSEFYPALGEYYRHRVDAHLDRQRD